MAILYERVDPWSWWSELRYLEQLFEISSLDLFQDPYQFQLDKQNYHQKDLS